jgi:hypothetical protein
MNTSKEKTGLLTKSRIGQKTKQTPGIARAVRELIHALRLESGLSDLRAG